MSTFTRYLGTVWGWVRLQGLNHLCQRQYALGNCFPSLTQPYVEAEQRRAVTAARLETRNAFFIPPANPPSPWS